MAAEPQDAQKRIIEKAIIKSTLGKYRSPFSLFVRGADVIIKLIDAAPIGKISQELQQSEKEVERILEGLSNFKRIEHIFELTAQMRLEKISAEEITEIEHLQSFSYFLTDFILCYPYSSNIKKSTIKISTLSEKEEISIEISAELTGIYNNLIDLQKEIEQKITAFKEKIRNQVSEDEREKMSEEEQERRFEEEKKLFVQMSLEPLPDLLKKFKQCFSLISSEKGVTSYEKTALEKQLNAVQTIQDDLAKKISEKEAESEISAQEIPEKKEVVVQITDTDVLLEKLKTFFMTKYNMTEEEATTEANAVLERAQKDSKDSDLSAALALPPHPRLSFNSAAPKSSFAFSLANAMKAVRLRNRNDSPVDADKLVDDFVSNIGQINEQAVLETKGRLNKSQIAKLPSAIKYISFKIKDADLKESETLHVLSILPQGDALNQLDNGYILVGHARVLTATLYYFHKDKKDKLVECHRGDLAKLCEHVSKSLKEGETYITLDRKQQREFVITPCGGHNYEQAEDAVPALVENLQQPVSASSSSSASSRVPQQKPSFDDHKIVLLQEGQDWPADIDIPSHTLYFKSDKSNHTLTVKYKKEDSTAFEYGRKIENLKNQQMISAAFERAELTLEAEKFLRHFTANPLMPRKSVILSKQQLPLDSIVPAASVDKKEEVAEESQIKSEEKAENIEKEEEKRESLEQASGSPKEKTELSSSPLSFLALPKSLTEGSDANPSAEGSSAASQSNSGGENPRL